MGNNLQPIKTLTFPKGQFSMGREAMMQYFAFAVSSDSPLFQFISQIGDFLQCCFRMRKPIMLKCLGNADLKPQFNLLSAQLPCRGINDSFENGIAERISVSIFENKTLSYNQTVFQDFFEQQLDLFSAAESQNYFYAFNSFFPHICKWNYGPADYLLLISTTRLNNLTDIVHKIAEFPQAKMTPISNSSDKKSTETLELLFYLFFESEIKINAERNYCQWSFFNFIKEDPSTLPPYSFAGLPPNIDRYMCQIEDVIY